MGSLDIPDVPHLHGALGAGRDVAEHQFEELPLRMARPERQAAAQRLFRGQPSLEGPAEKRERLVDRRRGADIEDGFLDRRPPGPMQLVDETVDVSAPAVDARPVRRRNSAIMADEQVEHRRWSRHDAVDERRCMMRPGGVIDGELRRQCARPPVVAPRNGQVDPGMHPHPPATLEAPPDGVVGHAGHQALATRQQSGLLLGHAVEVRAVTRRRWCAQHAHLGH